MLRRTVKALALLVMSALCGWTACVAVGDETRLLAGVTALAFGLFAGAGLGLAQRRSPRRRLWLALPWIGTAALLLCLAPGVWLEPGECGSATPVGLAQKTAAALATAALVLIADILLPEREQP